MKLNEPVMIQPPAVAPVEPPARSEKLSDGIYLITDSYAVIAINMADHITFIECGQSDARAVIAEAKRLIPGKPMKESSNRQHPESLRSLERFSGPSSTRAQRSSRMNRNHWHADVQRVRPVFK